MLCVLKFFWLMKYPCHRSPVYATYFFISKRHFFMIGYCCDDDKKLLVAEYMHHDTLAKHLFNWENQTIEWAMRL
ncbi:serine/threonine-protein kinase BSK1-like [Malus domestica]|uniref:serine/threonine-protein kinase BSK1-like n=1 Tax=Malus domestica TaxID=3750 RepID=UPI0014612189